MLSSVYRVSWGLGAAIKGGGAGYVAKRAARSVVTGRLPHASERTDRVSNPTHMNGGSGYDMWRGSGRSIGKRLSTRDKVSK